MNTKTKKWKFLYNQEIAFIPPEKIIENNELEEKKDTWEIEVKHNLKVIPDFVFALKTPKQTAYFLLEADRATMPIKRTNLKQTSIYKKMVVYWQAKKEKILQNKFNFSNTRILFVTPSIKRMDEMIKANKEVDDRHKGSRLFYFAPTNAFNLNEPEKILEKVWMNGRDTALSSLLN